MGKAEFKWTIGDMHYWLERKAIDLGAGRYSSKQVWELSTKLGNGSDAKWKQDSKGSLGLTRDEMIQHLASKFDRKPRQVECLIEKAEQNASGDGDGSTPVRKHFDVPRPAGGGIPTRQLTPRF